jgi:D-3-phosphoglycerate dehydrogenase / 2-oxoglutarate reductase
MSQEPPGPDHPLVNHERVVVTPHTAGVTEQSFTALGRAVADNVARLKRGEPLENVANHETKGG